MKKDKRHFPKPGTPGVVELSGGRRAHYVTPKFGRWRRYQMLGGVEIAAAGSRPLLWAEAAQEKRETVVRDCVVRLEGFPDLNDEDQPISTVEELFEFSADMDAIITIYDAIVAGTPMGAAEKKSSNARSASSAAGTGASTGTTAAASKGSRQKSGRASKRRGAKEGAAPAA